MSVFSILAHIRIQDVVDILLLSVTTYYLYIWFRDTKAFRALIGLLALAVVYTAARTWGLFLTTWVFQILWQVLILLLIILFQPEIRQVLERFNPLKNAGLGRHTVGGDWEKQLAVACFHLSARRLGALAIVERTYRVDELVAGGVALEATPSQEVFQSVFEKASPLHDGAVLVRRGRIVEAGCFLPLSSDEGLPQHLGTRHRAALGISERSDAWAIVVSEERGDVSIAQAGRLFPLASADALAEVLASVFQAPEPSRRSIGSRLHGFLRRNWREKAASVALVAAVWLMLAGQQNFEVSLAVPVDIQNLPHGLSLLEPAQPLVTVTVRGLRKDASTLMPKDVRLRLDATGAVPGSSSFRLFRHQISLPNAQVDVVKIEPSELSVVFGDIGRALPSPQ